LKIVILSGKGGTGKSSITSSLALGLSDEGIVLVDADVDCPNQHILFPGKNLRKSPLYVSKTALFDHGKNVSESCAQVCRFGALSVKNGKAFIDKIKCEGCGACTVLHPDAFSLIPKFGGDLIVREGNDFPLVYGVLEPGESGSGKIVFEVKKAAEEVANERGYGITLIDAPAGIGCPVIAAVTGCNYAVGVVEPTPASIANLQRALEVVSQFQIPYSIILNKAGLSEKYEQKIRTIFGSSLIAEIPYDEEVPRLLAKGIPPALGSGGAAEALKKAVLAVKEMTDL